MIKILVVDDEAISAMMLSLYLTDSGYAVRVANSGTEALRLSEDDPPDVLLSDWKLQDQIDGLELVRQLAPRYKDMKSIIISGLSADYVFDNEVKDKVFRFLTKPCGIDVVLATIREATGADSPAP